MTEYRFNRWGFPVRIRNGSNCNTKTEVHRGSHNNSALPWATMIGLAAGGALIGVLLQAYYEPRSTDAKIEAALAVATAECKLARKEASTAKDMGDLYRAKIKALEEINAKQEERLNANRRR